ncbi:Helix-turn-helix domain-containing protein [Natronorubrum sediminis]|uniref:Helix-turn-helix domain-containing protein n=1 Tax=Natronorubrum sediminis TaxID=640943 RepID=A0A1H6FSY8_9EURY|nr:helix-turn-helix domain-containing protein [Natronorubrum sediminis]SEH12885.1 Helix-turn-helix domain-containing protein [Natronorubrum sediminis]
MARLFPFRSEPTESEGQPRVVDLEGDDADAVFSALSSTTARRIYARLDDEPGTPSDVADAIDSSIQNVRYHLENLEEAGLVEVVDTWYSSRGNEMSVYATTDGPLIVTSDESAANRLREALSRFVGGLTVLAGGSLLVQLGLTNWAESAADGSAGGAGAPAGTDDADGTDDTDETGGDGADTEGDDVDGADADGTDDSSADDETDDDFGAQDADSDDEASGEDSTDGDGADGDGAGGESTTGDGSLEGTGDGMAEVAEVLFTTVPPGLLFFLGGSVVLLAVTAYWYWVRPAY